MRDATFSWYAHTHFKDQQDEDQQKDDLNTDDKELWEKVGQHGLQRTYTYRKTHNNETHTILTRNISKLLTSDKLPLVTNLQTAYWGASDKYLHLVIQQTLLSNATLQGVKGAWARCHTYNIKILKDIHLSSGCELSPATQHLSSSPSFLSNTKDRAVKPTAR